MIEQYMVNWHYVGGYSVTDNNTRRQVLDHCLKHIWARYAQVLGVLPLLQWVGFFPTYMSLYI
jgi:hypothetical protein